MKNTLPHLLPRIDEAGARAAAGTGLHGTAQAQYFIMLTLPETLFSKEIPAAKRPISWLDEVGSVKPAT